MCFVDVDYERDFFIVVVNVCLLYMDDLRRESEKERWMRAMEECRDEWIRSN